MTATDEKKSFSAYWSQTPSSGSECGFLLFRGFFGLFRVFLGFFVNLSIFWHFFEFFEKIFVHKLSTSYPHFVHQENSANYFVKSADFFISDAGTGFDYPQSVQKKKIFDDALDKPRKKDDTSSL